MVKGPTRSILQLLTGRKRLRLKPGFCVLSKIVRQDQTVGLCFMEGPPSHYREFPYLIVFNLAYFGDWPDKERLGRFKEFEDALYELLEDDAFHPMRIFFDGGKRWYVYARDREAFLAKSRALVEAFEDCWASTDGEYDPKWKVFREFEDDYLTADSMVAE